jgi:tetratricopeptide (TPR) repeat protein
MRLLFVLISAILSSLLLSCGDTAKKIDTSKLSLDSLIILYPDSVPLLVKKGNELIEKVQYQKALEIAAKAYRLDSLSFETRVLYAEALINKPSRSADDMLRGHLMYKSLVKANPKSEKALVGLANTYTMLEDMDNSFVYINKALRINPRYRDAYILKGTNYRLKQDLKLAISSYETAVQIDPKCTMAYLSLAVLYELNGDAKLGMEKYTTAYQLEPKNTEVIYALAFAKENLGQTNQAMNLYRKMARIDSTYADAYFHIARIYQFDKPQLDSAIFYYKKAIKANQEHIPSYHNLGLVYE